MTTTILGISAYYHDSAACLVRDGEIVAAAQEERFTRKKHDAGFPHHAVAYCLREGGITRGRARLRRLLRQAAAQVRAPPRDLPRRRAARPALVPDRDAGLAEGEALHPRRDPRRSSPASTATILFAEHHESHAASAFYPVAVRRGGGPHHRRRRRVGDVVVRRRARATSSSCSPSSTSRTRSACSTRPSPTSPASR